MNIKKSELKQIIKEETHAVLIEQKGKRRGFLRQMFRMDHPKVDDIAKRYDDAVTDVHGQVDDARREGADALTDLLLKLQDLHSDHLKAYEAASGFDASKEQRARIKEIDQRRRELYRKIDAMAEEAETNARSRRRREEAKRAAEEQERIAREIEREKESAARSDRRSGSGSAYDKFGKKWQDRNVIDISRLEETIANTLKEILEGK